VITIKLKAVHANAVIPQRKTSLSSGADIFSVESFTIPAKGWVLADTGLVVADMPALAGYLDKPLLRLPHERIEIGLELQVRARSGEAAKRGIFVLNEPGTVDADYRGPIKVILANFSDEDAVFPAGLRIAQLVCGLVLYVNYELVSAVEVTETERGAGGFGSTGVS
jgi:dUTP pyrophosphatase